MRHLVRNVFAFDLFPLFPPFPAGKAVGGHCGKAAIPMETTFPPIFNMAGTFDSGLGDPFPLRGVRIPVQQPVVKTPDNPVFGYPDSLKGLAPGIPAYIVRLVRFDVVRLGLKRQGVSPFPCRQSLPSRIPGSA
jgi:hypothetical protein